MRISEDGKKYYVDNNYRVLNGKMTEHYNVKINTSKASYLFVFLNLFSLFIINYSVKTPLVSYPLRVGFLFSALMILIFFPALINIFINFIRKAKGWIAIGCIYLLVQPFIIMCLFGLKIRQPTSNITLISPLVSGFSWVVSLILLIIIYSTFAWNNYKKMFYSLYFLSIIVSVDAVFFFYIYPNFHFTETDRFDGSIFHMGSPLCGRLGFLLLFLSLILRKISTNKYRKMYLIGIPLGMLLAFSSGTRSALIVTIISIILLSVNKMYRKFRRDQPFIFLATMMLIFSFFVIIILPFSYKLTSYKKSYSLASADTFWTRTITWSRGIELGLRNFPLGLGGGLLVFYNAAPEIEYRLPEKVKEFFGDPGGLQSFKMMWYKKFKPKAHSIHSVQIEIFTGFGFFGLIILFYSFYIPIKYLWFVMNRLKVKNWDIEIEISVLLSIMLLCYQLWSLTESGNAEVWVIGLFYLFLIRSLYFKKRKLNFVKQIE